MVVAHGAEQMGFRWPFDVSLVSLTATLIDTGVRDICSAFAGQTHNANIMDSFLIKEIKEKISGCFIILYQ